MRYIYNAEKGNFSKKTIFRRFNSFEQYRDSFRIQISALSMYPDLSCEEANTKKEGRILDQKSQNIETNPHNLLLNMC